MRRFLIDTDTASDDAVAILMALARSGSAGGRADNRIGQRGHCDRSEECRIHG